MGLQRPRVGILLQLTVPGMLESGDPQTFARELQARVAAREDVLRGKMATAGRRFMGAHEVRRQRRDARLKTHELRRGRHPTVASRDRTRRLGALERLRRFRDAYRAALERWRSHGGPVRFPEGTYKLRGYPGVMAERAPPVSC
jgi:putative transposase